MSFDFEFEFGLREQPPARRFPKGQPWCGACHTYHSLNEGCDEQEER